MRERTNGSKDLRHAYRETELWCVECWECARMAYAACRSLAYLEHDRPCSGLEASIPVMSLQMS